MRPSEFSLK